MSGELPSDRRERLSSEVQQAAQDLAEARRKFGTFASDGQNGTDLGRTGGGSDMGFYGLGPTYVESYNPGLPTPAIYDNGGFTSGGNGGNGGGGGGGGNGGGNGNSK